QRVEERPTVRIKRLAVGRTLVQRSGSAGGRRDITGRAGARAEEEAGNRSEHPCGNSLHDAPLIVARKSDGAVPAPETEARWGKRTAQGQLATRRTSSPRFTSPDRTCTAGSGANLRGGSV